MTSLPNSPRLLKGGLVLLNPQSNTVERLIVLQYNPVSLSRTLQAQSMGENADRSEALRLTGPPQETIKIEAEIDAADQIEPPNQNESLGEYGILPQLAALETILYPMSSRLESNNQLASIGTLEITPVESPLTLFVWSKQRILPVRITEYSVTEEAFDPKLNPLRAKVNLGMRVLNINDLGFNHRGGSLFMKYHQNLERLSELSRSGTLDIFGIGGLL